MTERLSRGASDATHVHHGRGLAAWLIAMPRRWSSERFHIAPVMARVVAAVLLAASIAASGAEPAGSAGSDTPRTVEPAPRPSGLPYPSRVPEDYRIGPTDTLYIHVWGHEDLTRIVPVRPDGRLSAPLLEDLEAAGKTPAELARDLEQALAEYVLSPQVTVVVTEARGLFGDQIRVVGAAVGPGQVDEAGVPQREAQLGEPRSIPYEAGMTLLDVIIALGGVSDFADAQEAVVIREEGGVTRRIPVDLDALAAGGDPSANIAMAPGDVLYIPEGYFMGDWAVTYTLGATLTFTDNVSLLPDPLAESALIFSLSPAVNVRGEGARVTGALDAVLDVNFQYFLDDNRLDQDSVVPALTLLGRGNAELVDDRVFLDAGASVSQQSRDTNEASSVSQYVNTNRETVVALDLSPYLVGRVGGYADGELRYGLGVFHQSGDQNSGVLELFNDDATTNFTNRLSATLVRGPEYSLLTWRTTAFVSHQTRDDQDGGSNDGIFRAEWMTGAEYPVYRSVSLLGDIGWQYRDEGDAGGDDLNDPTWFVGARWRPSPRLDLTAKYGQSDARDNLYVDLFYRPGPRTQIFANYTERLETPAELAQRQVFDLGVNEEGQIIDETTGQPADPTQNPFDLNDQTTFNRLFNGGVNHVIGRNVFTLGGLWSKQEAVTGSPDQRRSRVLGGWSRRLNPQITAGLDGSYEWSDRGGREDETLRLNVRLDYAMFRNLGTFATYGYQNRQSNFEIFEFTENVVTVGVAATF